MKIDILMAKMIFIWFQSKLFFEIQSKNVPQENFGDYGVTKWDFRGSLKSPILRIFVIFGPKQGPPKTRLSDPITPNFFLWAHFDCNSTIFYREKI